MKILNNKMFVEYVINMSKIGEIMRKMTVYTLDKKNHLQKKLLEEAFPFLNEKGHIISFVGGGGKTTLMELMASYCAVQGMRTLVTTTTHIGIPQDGRYAVSVDEVNGLWAGGSYAVVGESMGNRKLSMLQEKKLREYIELADVTLIEADGAKRLPCKVPRDREPVLLPDSDIVIGVMGADTLDRPCREVCFCLKETTQFLRTDETHRMTADDMAKILSSDQGTRKGVGDRPYYTVIHKCDVIDIGTQGTELLMQMKKHGLEHPLLTTCREETHG